MEEWALLFIEFAADFSAVGVMENRVFSFIKMTACCRAAG